MTILEEGHHRAGVRILWSTADAIAAAPQSPLACYDSSEEVLAVTEDRHERAILGDALAEAVGAAPVHRIGKIVILGRARPDRPE